MAFLLVPFFSSLWHLSNNRKLLVELRDQLPKDGRRRIYWFSDTMNDLNGVSVTLKSLGWRFYEHGIDVNMVTILRENELSGEVPPNTINLPATYEFALPYYTDYILKIPSILRALKILSSEQPDEIMISTPGPVGVLGLVMARLMNIPAIGIYHTDFTWELQEIVQDEAAVETVEASVRWFYSLMDEIKVPTREYIDILSKRGLDGSKMSVFPRQIDQELFRYRGPEEWGDLAFNLPDGFTLLSVGRVSKDKNLEFLLEVYREVVKVHDDINLVVVGEGPYLSEMKKEVGNQPRAKFFGRVHHDALPRIYSQGDYLVFPSITDTYGMVVLEAQCCGLPALVSDRGGPKEIIEDGVTGFMIGAMDLDAWVKRILELYDLFKHSPEAYRKMRLSARARAKSISGWEAVLKTLAREELKPGPVTALSG